MDFLLSDYKIEISRLRYALQRQVVRAQKRLEGVEFLLSLLNQKYLQPSVLYFVLKGWLGLMGGSYPGPLLNYMDSVQLIPANERLLLDLTVQKLDCWAINKLRDCLLEVEVWSHSDLLYLTYFTSRSHRTFDLPLLPL
eukprot:sb/3474401/